MILCTAFGTTYAVYFKAYILNAKIIYYIVCKTNNFCVCRRCSSSEIFNTNIVLVEYRYFDKSMPTPCLWQYLTVENSLYDLHHVNQTLRTMYKGKWIATGISKGGQTTMFYRSYFPDDVDISVPYVAPLNRSVEDCRHEKFLQHKVSTKENRQKVLDFQLLLFKRKATLLPMLDEYCRKQHYTFNAPIDEIFDFSVLEYAFAFWQWGYDINKIPTATATDRQVFDYLINMCEPNYFANQNTLISFNVQAARELGYYGYYTKPFKKYLSIKTAKGYLRRLMLPKGTEDTRFEPALYRHTVDYLTHNDPKNGVHLWRHRPMERIGRLRSTLHQEQAKPPCLHAQGRLAQYTHTVLPQAYTPGNNQSDRRMA